MKIRKILESQFIRLKKKRLKKYYIKTYKKNTKTQKINYDNYWKKYYKDYKNIFHNFYFEKTGIDSKYFIPDDFYYTEIDMRLNNWFAAKYIDDKNLYDCYFPDILQPLTIAKRINGTWLINQTIQPFDNVIKKLDKENEIVCKKSNNSSGGSGVFFIKKDNLVEVNNIKGDLIIQKVIKQSKELEKLSKTSLNTIRILTILIDNKVEVLSTIIRFGINGSRVDNATSGGLTCGINDDGRLKNVAYKANGDRYTANPNTSEKFSDIVIPNFAQILELAKHAHNEFPYFGLVSWDFALNEQNDPVLIEANLSYGELDFHQLNNGPLFGNRTDYYLDKILKLQSKTSFK